MSNTQGEGEVLPLPHVHSAPSSVTQPQCHSPTNACITRAPVCSNRGRQSRFTADRLKSIAQGNAIAENPAAYVEVQRLE